MADENEWYIDPYAELHRTNDRDRFLESPDKGDYPVYGGKNIYLYSYDDTFLDIQSPEFWSVNDGNEKDAKERIRGKKQGDLKDAIFHELNLSGSSMKKAVNELLKKRRGRKLEPDDVLLDCTSPRIVYRNIGRPTDERTMIAAVIPEDIVCHNKIQTIQRFTPKPQDRSQLEVYPLHDVYESIFTDKELFVALGLLNSLPLGYLMRSKIDSTINKFKVRECQMPRLTEGDEWFDFIWRRAARLNCYGDGLEDLREDLEIEPVENKEKRDELRAEIDAAALHAYGLDENEAKFLIEDFYKTDDPTLMTPDYFELVKEKYEEVVN